MPETKKIPEIKSDEEAIEMYAGILERTGLSHKEAVVFANTVFSPLINAKKPKTAK